MNSPYAKLALMLVINGLIMFGLTYALIDRWEHFVPNINRLYMAVIMVSAMVPTMVGLMWSMYPDARVKAGVIGGAVVVFTLFLILARTQTPVGNEQFLRSMIPHHSSAILMCEHGDLTDPEIVALCGDIVEAQEREIDQMRAMLERH